MKIVKPGRPEVLAFNRPHIGSTWRCQQCDAEVEITDDDRHEVIQDRNGNFMPINTICPYCKRANWFHFVKE